MPELLHTASDIAATQVATVNGDLTDFRRTTWQCHRNREGKGTVHRTETGTLGCFGALMLPLEPGQRDAAVSDGSAGPVCRPADRSRSPADCRRPCPVGV